MKAFVTGLLVLSVVALIVAVANLFINLTFENVSVAVMAFLVTLGLATLELHLEGVTTWNSDS